MSSSESLERPRLVCNRRQRIRKNPQMYRGATDHCDGDKNFWWRNKDDYEFQEEDMTSSYHQEEKNGIWSLPSVVMKHALIAIASVRDAVVPSSRCRSRNLIHVITEFVDEKLVTSSSKFSELLWLTVKVASTRYVGDSPQPTRLMVNSVAGKTSENVSTFG